MSTVPAMMKAIVLEGVGRISVKDHPVPALGDDDVLVKIVAVSLNPTDWKHVDKPVGKPGSILGCDFSGTVVQVGGNVTSPNVGDHVAAFVHGGAFADEGAFAEYVKTPAELVWVVPENTITHEEAATLGCAFWTAAQAFYHPNRLALPELPQKAPGDEWIFVYGGSSGVGLSAIQLAHLSGYKVVTTASPHNFALVQSFGADAVFDYKDPEVVSKIKAATGHSIVKALDSIAVKESQQITVEVIAPSGGKVIVVEYPIVTEAGVEVIHTLIYTALGRAFDFGPTTHYPISLEDRDQIAKFLKEVPKLIQDGTVKPLPIKKWEGGLDAIHEGLQYMREGNVSAQKVVYRL